MDIFVINHNNPERKLRMQRRFETLGISFKFSETVGKEDIPVEYEEHKDVLSPCMLSHLKCIEKFLQGNNEYCIIAEDDVYLRKTFKEDLISILADFSEMNLDILLLGYLINAHPGNYFNLQRKNSIGYQYYDYDSELWGTQMYLISRKYAEYCIKTFTIEAAINKEVVPFASDWTITKNGNRALLYPMLAVEEGIINDTDYWQVKFHADCKNFNYSSEKYI